MSKRITFGTDPEFALVNKGTRSLVPPEWLIHFKGLKPVEVEVNELGVRHPIFIKTENFSVIGDGALFEYTIKPDEDMRVVYSRVKLAEEALAELGDKYGLEILHSPIADFDVEFYFNNMEEDVVKESVIAGCDPDQDAIDSKYISEVRDLTFWPKRGAGGHIHLGVPDYPELHDHILPAIRLMAITSGNTYIKYTTDEAAEKERQVVFGKPGRFRPQKYKDTLGLEYRTPSNSWLISEEIALAMAEASRKAIFYLKNPEKGIEVIDTFLEDTIKAITTVDKEKAKTVLAEIM